MVFGSVAGEAIAEHARNARRATPDVRRFEVGSARSHRAARGARKNPFALRKELGSIAWDHLGIIRSATSLRAASGILERIREKLAAVAVPAKRAGHAGFHERLNVENLLTVARLIQASADLRKESRGSHYREDFPDTKDEFLVNIHLRKSNETDIQPEIRPVQFTRRKPEDLQGDTIIPSSAPAQRAMAV